SLLATSAVHHHLIRTKKRTQVALVIETAETREVNHYALLIGYGASMINPYVAYAIIEEQCFAGNIKLDYVVARENYIKAVNKGLLKILSKMGISTLRSYHGAQIFEAVGLNQKFTDKYFNGTDSRIGGLGLNEIAREALTTHSDAFTEKIQNEPVLKTSGIYHYRIDGEKHGWNPETIGLLQWATRINSYEKFKEFSHLVNSENRKPMFLRGCVNLKKGKPIPIDEVESVEDITKRFVTGAMSFGSISKEAHETLAV
ncbi:unnamed protein product, partial [marine sediment metagenome]